MPSYNGKPPQYRLGGFFAKDINTPKVFAIPQLFYSNDVFI